MIATRIKAASFRAAKNNVFVTDLEQGDRRTLTGLILLDDVGKANGVNRDRWARVWQVGADIEDIKVGEWVLVKAGRWTPGIDLELDNETVRVWRVEYPEAVILASDEDPRDTVAATPAATPGPVLWGREG